MHLSTSVVVARFEVCERRCGAAFEAELGAELCPVEFEGRAALWVNGWVSILLLVVTLCWEAIEGSMALKKLWKE